MDLLQIYWPAYGGYMSKTTLEVDDAKVEMAKSILGTKTLRETVDRALEAVLVQAARRSTIERLRSMNGLDLDKPEVLDAAWR